MRANDQKPSGPSQIVIEKIVAQALEEDLSAGDITSDACIDSTAVCNAKAVARHDLIACGAHIAATVFQLIDPSLQFKIINPEGSLLKQGDLLWEVSGNTRSVLMGERVALNFVQRMSGIATMTYTYVQAIPKGYSTRIADTRKTTPGLRPIERYAVRVGGGFSHRDNLSSSILIKDNHIASCGSVKKAIDRAKAYKSHTCSIECEVDTLDQLKEALNSGADIVLLDNMDTQTIIEAVKIAKGKAITEASGGITLSRIPELALAGVDVISCGALTHSAPSADIGLDM